MQDSRPLGIFGGTFDPVHFGHLRLAEEAVDSLDLAGIRWIPAGQPKHRAAPHVGAAHRLRMVELAVAGNPRFAVDAAEVESDASYTVPTLERLRVEFGEGRSLVLLLGADAYAGLAGWHRWQEIFSLAHIAVTHRPGYAIDAATLPPALAEEHVRRFRPDGAAFASSAAGCIGSFAMTPLSISATDIRERLQAGCSVRYLLPRPVIDYIQTHRLYLRQTPATDGS